MTVDTPAGEHVYVDGRIRRRGAASVSVLDHGLLYGDGCFDAFAVTGRWLFRYADHRRRLEESIRALGIDVAVLDDLDGGVRAVVEANGLSDSYVKVVVTRGVGPLPRINHHGLEPTIVIFAEPRFEVAEGARPPSGVTLASSQLRRTPPDVLDPRIKSLN